MSTIEAINKALNNVIDPELHKPLPELGMVESVDFKDGNAVIGILKAYTTRVGSGPFPTELFDADGEALRKIGGEVGVTTGRNRRCGWFDAPIARYAVRVNGLTDFFLTKLDVLTGWEKIPVCVAYEVDGVRVEELPASQTDFHHTKPQMMIDTIH